MERVWTLNDQPPAATADDALFMLLQVLIAASQGFSITDVGWHNWGFRRNADFRRNFHDLSAWNWRPPQDSQWTQISALNNWQSFIKSNQGIAQVLAGKDVAQRVRGILQQYDRRVIPAFNEIEMRTLERSRVLISTLSVQWTHRVLCSLANLPAGTNVLVR